MCEYCEKKTLIFDDVTPSGDIIQVTVGRYREEGWNLIMQVAKGPMGLMGFDSINKISFCPFCGRKLED